MAAARSDERRLVRRGQIAARSDQKRAASHRRIDDSELKDALGFGAVDERAERPADEVLCNWLRRVKRAGRFAGSRSRAELYPCATSRRRGRDDLRSVIKQRFVDR